jgi:hypothetical protein
MTVSTQCDKPEMDTIKNLRTVYFLRASYMELKYKLYLTSNAQEHI